MSFDIPQYFEPQIEKYAQALHISHDEAVIRLIQTGLSATPPAVSPRDILGAFATADQSSMMDEAVELAMRDRQIKNS